MSKRVRLTAGTTGNGTETQDVSIALAMIRGVSAMNTAPAVWLIVTAEEGQAPRIRRIASPTSHEFKCTQQFTI